MKKCYIGIVAVVVALGILVYVQSNPSIELEEFVGGRTTREIVSDLENSGVNSPVFAVAFPDRIELSDGDSTLNLYDDYFYASIAPFINFTHD